MESQGSRCLFLVRDSTFLRDGEDALLSMLESSLERTLPLLETYSILFLLELPSGVSSACLFLPLRTCGATAASCLVLHLQVIGLGRQDTCLAAFPTSPPPTTSCLARLHLSYCLGTSCTSNAGPTGVPGPSPSRSLTSRLNVHWFSFPNPAPLLATTSSCYITATVELAGSAFLPRSLLGSTTLLAIDSALLPFPRQPFTTGIVSTITSVDFFIIICFSVNLSSLLASSTPSVSFYMVKF